MWWCREPKTKPPSSALATRHSRTLLHAYQVQQRPQQQHMTRKKKRTMAIKGKGFWDKENTDLLGAELQPVSRLGSCTVPGLAPVQKLASRVMSVSMLTLNWRSPCQTTRQWQLA